MRFRPGVEHAFLVVGLAFAAGAWLAYDITIRRPRTWPHTDALVVSSRVINPEGPQSYSPEIVFRYDAGGERREAVVVPSWTSSSYDLVRGHVDRYPAGMTTRVAVNPADPGDVRYDLSASLINLVLPGVLGMMGLVFAGIGGGVIAAGRRSAARRPTAADLQHASTTAARVSQTAWRVALVFVAIGVILEAIGIALVRLDVQTLREWPAIEATVVDSRIVSVSSMSSTGHGPRVLYDNQVTFRYLVGDRAYENATSYGIASSSQSSATEMLNKYAPGTVHLIRYRPGDPNIIRFDMDSYVSVFLMSGVIVAMGLVFGGFGLLILWSLRQDARAATSGAHPAAQHR